MCIEKIDSCVAKLLELRVGDTGNCDCGHKVEAIFSWKTIYPTDGPQTTQSSPYIRRGDPKDSIIKNHKKRNSCNGFRPRIEAIS